MSVSPVLRALALAALAASGACTPPDAPPTGAPHAASLRFAELAVVPVDTPRGFTAVRAFHATQPVHLAVPSDLDGACDAYVVDELSTGSTLGAALSDVRGAPTSVDGPDGLVRLAEPGGLDALGPRGTGHAYDLVLDCDGDGVLSEEDVLDGTGFSVLPPLTLPGPHAVTTATHSDGPWLEQQLYHPADIDELGVLPIVVIAHGFGHELTYYDHLGEHLASYGYVVMTFRNDVGNGDSWGTRTAADTLLSNTEHLLAEQSTIAGAVLEGHLDGSRIAWLGHSTGGECVVHAYTQLHSGDFRSDWFGPDDIALVSSLAPVAWLGRAQSHPRDVPYHLITGGADRDTANYPEEGYTQNLALFERANGPRHLTYIHGAGHGDLHAGPQNWLDRPEPGAPGLIGPEGAHPVVKSVHLALLEHYTRGDDAMLDFFERADFQPSGIPADVVTSMEYRPDPDTVAMVADFQSASGLLSLDVANAAEVRMADQDGSYAWNGSQPSNGFTRASVPADDPRALVFDWAPGSSGSIDIEVPPEVDASAYRAVMFRVAQGTRHPYTQALDGPLSFTVGLRDAHGTQSSVDFAAYGTATRPYPRTGSGPGAGWTNELVTITVPLADLAAETGLDLEALEAVFFEVGVGKGSAQGRAALDDVLFVASRSAG